MYQCDSKKNKNINQFDCDKTCGNFVNTHKQVRMEGRSKNYFEITYVQKSYGRTKFH